MMLRKRSFRFAAVAALGLVATAAALSSTATGQTVVVSAKSIKELAGDLEYLIKAVAPKDDPGAQGALEALRQFQEGDLIKGIDQSRGLGLAVTLPMDFPAGGGPSIVVAVPVTDLGDFLGSIQGLGVAVDDRPGVEGFSHKVTLPDGNTSVLALQSKGYALFSMTAGDPAKLKEMDPASWAAKGRPGVALTARVNLSRIPRGLKEQFLGQLETQAGRDEQPREGESQAEFRARIAGEKAGVAAFKGLASDGESLELDLGLDRKAQELSLNLSLAARPGTGLAKSLGAFRARRSRFEELGRGAQLAAWASLPISGAFRDGIVRGRDPIAKADLPGAVTPEQKRLIGRFVELVKANLDAPDLDLGLALKGAPAAAGKSHFAMAMGLKVRDGKAFDRLFRDAVAEFKPGEGFTMKFDAAKAADGTAIHELTGPYDEDNEDVVRIFGKPSLSFAFRDDAIVGAFGEDSVGAVKRAVEAIAGPPVPGTGVEPVAMVARLAGFAELNDTEKEREAFRKASAEVFRGDDAKRDRVSMVLRGEGDAIRLRLAIDVPALRFLALAGKED